MRFLFEFLSSYMLEADAFLLCLLYFDVRLVLFCWQTLGVACSFVMSLHARRGRALLERRRMLLMQRALAVRVLAV